MKLIFATNNQHKVDEIMSLLPAPFSVLSLKQAGVDIDIPEPHETLQDNAAEKAKTIYQLLHADCFSEDTGLEVYALNNEPGVKSARYAGEGKSFDKNIEKLLLNLQDSKDRSARFRTVICLILNGREYYFEGTCEGTIIEERRGEQGFGYDPVFIPEGSEKTFAEMSLEEKNSFSHRSRAVTQLVTFLNNLNVNTQ
ncbi:MAG TPA: RdgB/HAM1 family non-canonical purine NTP pyrophosphatase [Flavisolibacter sp.]|nr:RdgB/HAM1 family non-canonical purine NTP pyrophosphatase [Flavisolibacter sp.]